MLTSPCVSLLCTMSLPLYYPKGTTILKIVFILPLPPLRALSQMYSDLNNILLGDYKNYNLKYTFLYDFLYLSNILFQGSIDVIAYNCRSLIFTTA